MTEWQSADDRNNRERISRARQAAEDLFRPAPQNNGVEFPRPAANGAPASEPPRRQPRIFTIPPRPSANAEEQTPIAPKPNRQRATVKPRTGAVPASHIGRVRALTSYGMTPKQVAELYGVTVAEIERIVRTPAFGKSR